MPATRTEIIDRLQNAIPHFGRKRLTWRNVKDIVERENIAVVMIPGFLPKGALVGKEQMRDFLESLGALPELSKGHNALLVLDSTMSGEERTLIAIQELAHFLLKHDFSSPLTPRTVRQYATEADMVGEIAMNPDDPQADRDMRKSRLS